MMKGEEEWETGATPTGGALRGGGDGIGEEARQMPRLFGFSGEFWSMMRAILVREFQHRRRRPTMLMRG
jgi:hypothetical protein